VTVRGAQRRPATSGSDFQIDVGQLASVVGQKNASELLQLAPGIFIANEGGSGHADQVFLRGFNAEQGQAIEFTFNGVPINEVDNPDGHGYADTHFIIPELVKSLHVIEGPFDPHQGDFAEAGSANYELAVPDRKLLFEAWTGSFNTQRLLTVWAPEHEREGTFGAVQVYKTDGFGVNRAGSDASAMAQYEGELGQRGLWRLLATAYATHYNSAGVVRSDDVASGRIDYYGTEDPSQGGDAQRYTLAFSLQNPVADGVFALQVFLTFRTLRIVEDFTGFLLDPQTPGQSIHPQRGDAIEQDYQALTAGSRASYRLTRSLLGLDQSLEVGAYARYDHTTPEIQRLRFGTQVPYAVDEDLVTDIMNLAGYLDLDLNPTRWLSLRGGVRQEFFDYNVLNACATGGYVPGAPLNQICPPYDLSGPRLPTQRATAAGAITEPKVSAFFKLPEDLTLTASYGIGAQSLAAPYIIQNQLAPFAQIDAAEAGVLYHRRYTSLDLSARAIAYLTKVSQDLIFNPTVGRLALSTGTTRKGVVAALRATGTWVDESASFTYADATYDQDGTLVPYVPITLARSDTAVFGPLPSLRLSDHPFLGTAGLGLNFIGTRALPFSQSAAPTLEVDASASLRWYYFKLGLIIQNLADSRYPLSQFFYASDFHSRPYPTLAPAAAFTAASPRTVLLTLALILDKESDR
jgi:hypothetical protein